MTERRVIILRAAERLLVHYGPAKTTVADIAREARVGVGSVYLEFTSKGAIVEALSEAQHASVLEAERRAWHRPGPARARLRRVFDARFEAFTSIAEGPAHARDLLLCDAPSVQSVHRRFQAAEHAQLEAMLGEGIEAGELPRMDTRPVARALLRAYAAFAPPLLFREPLERLRHELPTLHALVLDRL
ncbi:MAG: TetR/AcrR family transcriptional regulator [Myxococcota bacterium]